MPFIKRSLTQSEWNRVTSILKKIYKNQLDFQQLESTCSEDGSIIFALYKKGHGREPHNDYILLTKQEYHLIRAETFWDVKTYDGICYISACFHDNTDPTGYRRSIDEDNKNITIQFSNLANEALAILSDNKEQFYFKDIA